MFDACSRLETVQESIWTKKPEPVPRWIEDLVTRIAEDCGVPFLRPTIRVTRVGCDTTFGGRWFHKHNGIGLILHESQAIVRGTLVHEMGHWRRWVFGGDEPGEHDAYFYEQMEEMYPHYRIGFQTAKTIEAAPPKRWEEKKLW